jgi:hypothetical protein
MIDYVLTLIVVDRDSGDVLLRRARSTTIASFDGVDDRALFDKLARDVKDTLAPGASTVVELRDLGTAVRDSGRAAEPTE